jgi:hypothetical protein
VSFRGGLGSNGRSGHSCDHGVTVRRLCMMIKTDAHVTLKVGVLANGTEDGEVARQYCLIRPQNWLTVLSKAATRC